MPSTRGYSTDAAFDPNAVAALLAVRALFEKLREKKLLKEADIAAIKKAAGQPLRGATAAYDKIAMQLIENL